MGKKVVILGGTGKMGRWLAKFLKDRGLNVAIHSRSPERAGKAARELGVDYIKSMDSLQDFDMVIVSTSLSSTAETVRKAAQKMKPNAVLFDIASVKGEAIEALEEARKRGVKTISVHPMFGPGADTLSGKHVIVIPVGDDPELVNEIRQLFEGAETHILSSGEAHDMMVALTLSLPHFLNIVFGKTLKEADIEEVTKFAGTTFTLQLAVAESVYSEDPELYYEIQSGNKAFAKVLDVFLEATRETALTIKRKDRETFVKNFREIRASLAKDPNYSNAYSRFYKAYNAVTKH